MQFFFVNSLAWGGWGINDAHIDALVEDVSALFKNVYIARLYCFLNCIHVLCSLIQHSSEIYTIPFHVQHISIYIHQNGS